MLSAIKPPLTALAERLFSPTALNTLADVLDNRFTLPGTSIRVGWDFILGLIPIAGDVISAVIASYIVAGALWHGADWRLLGRMMVNILIDLLLGLIPVIGDFFDAGWMSNARNVRLLNAHLARAVS